MKRVQAFLIFVSISIFTGCAKDDFMDSPGNPVVTRNCTSMFAQDTITHNAINYYLISSSGADDELLIEVMNASENFSENYSMELFQVTNDNDCYETITTTELVVIDGKAFQFENCPSWSIDTNTVSKLHIKLDGTSYYLQDLQLNQ